MSRLFTIPLGGGLLQFVRDIIKKENMEEIAVVFPGRRPSIYLKEMLSKDKDHAFFPPWIFSMEEFIEYLLREKGLKRIDYPDALFLLYKTSLSTSIPSNLNIKEGNFGEFSTWGHYLLNFIDMLDMEDVEEKRLKNVEKNAEIGYEVPEKINSLLRSINALRKNYHELLLEKGYATRGLKYLLASRDLEIGKGIQDFKRVFFCGFFALTQVEKKIVRSLWERDMATVILEGNREDWSIIGEFIDFLKAKEERIETKRTENFSLNIYKCFDTHTEALRVYEILKRHKEGKVAIVLPDPHSLFPLLTFCVDRIGKGYNITLGYPFLRTSLYGLIFFILKAQLTKKGKGIYTVPEYMAILSNPFVKNLTLKEDIREEIFKIEEFLLSKDEPVIDLSEIETLFSSTAVKDLHTMFFYKIEDCETLKALANSMEAISDFILSHTEIRSYVLSFEFFKAFFESLESLKSLEIGNARFHEDKDENSRYLFEFFLHFLKGIRIPFETRPLEDIEIMGVLETRCLSFDKVIFLDMNERTFPKQRSIDPLIPTGVYGILGLPAPAYEEDIFRYYFYRLIASAKDLHLLYIEDEERPRSRYIEELIWREEKQKKKIGVVHIIPSNLRINLKPKAEKLEIRKTEKIIDFLKSKVFSASSIDEYLKCPISFYFKYILNLRERPELAYEIEEGKRGEIIHKILKETYEGFLNRKIEPSLYDRLLTNLKNSLERHLGEKKGGEFYLLHKIAEKKLISFLKKDVFEGKKPFYVLFVEVPVNGRLAFGEMNVSFTGIIDRVDYLVEKDEYVVIDYKSGNAFLFKSKKEDQLHTVEGIRNYISSFQLPIYLELFAQQRGIPKEKMNGKLILLRKNKEDLLFSEEDERRERIKQIMDLLSTVLREIFDPEKPFRRFDERHCERCTFGDLCKV